MARGWESKAVEDQQQEAMTRSVTPSGPAPDSGREAERAVLQLARTRALADLQLACAPAHRGMLERAIRDLEARLEGLK